MIFRIAAELFHANGEDLPELLAIVRLGYQRRHRVYLDPPRSTVDTWLASLSEGEAAWVRAAFDSALRTHPVTERVTVRVVPGDASTWHPRPPELCVHDAHRLAHIPLRLLVEDFGDDADFILWGGSAHGGLPWERLRVALDRGWVERDHGGGIESMHRRVDTLDELLRRRTWVMFDHDGLQPGEPNRSRPSQALRDRCDEVGVARHALSRRAIENYLPIKVLERWAKDEFRDEEHGAATRRDVLARRKMVVDAFRRLSPDQRRHYHLREGLRKDADADGELPTSFQSVAIVDQAALACGFDAYDREGVTRLFGDARAQVRVGALHDDGSMDEVRAILQSIVGAL